jgi:hypothetical protein
MHNPVWLAVGAAFVLVGGLLMRWAGRYDATGIAVDAAWRMAKTRSTTGARDELGRVIDEQLTDIRADAERIGHTRTAIKHGWRFFIARFVSVAGLILIALGLVLIGAAFWWT